MAVQGHFASDIATDPSSTLATSVYERLRRDILTTALLPSEKLAMEALRARYSIGGSPLREALNRLVAERLVTQEDQKGFRVAPVSIERLRELTHTRCLIHEIALREFMRSADEDWEDAIVLSFRRLSRAQKEFGMGPVTKQRHMEFHRSLINRCGSNLLHGLSEDLYAEAERYRALSISAAIEPRDHETEHRTIMEAVLGGDVETAVVLSNDHIRLTEKILLDLNVLPGSKAQPNHGSTRSIESPTRRSPA